VCGGQAQLYVNGAREATKLVRFKGNAAEAQRVAYAAACGSEPTREWEADANIMAELASVCDADEGDLEAHLLAWGPVPAGTWQAIGDVGVVHHGPATDALRVIIVLVLTVKSDDGWKAVQYAGPSVLLSLSNALGLVKWPVIDEIATYFFQNRTKLEGATYETYMAWLGEQRKAFDATHVRAALAEDEDLSTPDRPDFLPWLAEMLGAQRWHYTVHDWNALYAMAFISEVVDHAAVARGDVRLLEEHVDEFERPDTTARNHVRKLRFSEEQVGAWQHKWQPVYDAQHDANSEECECEACSSKVVGGYVPEAQGVEQCGNGRLRFRWVTEEQLPPDVYAEAFRIESGELTVCAKGEADLVFRTGETGVLHAGFDGFLYWQEGVDFRKAYEYLDAAKRPHGKLTTCDSCGLGCGDESYSWKEAADTDCATMTNAALSDVCRRLGLRVTGNKAGLQERIRAANDGSLTLAAESKDICRVCYLKCGPDWAAQMCGAVRRYRSGSPLPLSDAEQARVEHFRAGAMRERNKYGLDMDGSDCKSEKAARAKVSRSAAGAEFHF
jgi:hypothetical protein